MTGKWDLNRTVSQSTSMCPAQDDGFKEMGLFPRSVGHLVNKVEMKTFDLALEDTKYHKKRSHRHFRFKGKVHLS